MRGAWYYIYKIFKKKDDPEYMPLHIVEDLFYGRPQALEALVEKLIKRKEFNSAYGICLRNATKRDDCIFN